MSEPGWPFDNRPTPEKVWAVWKTGRLMEAEINEHPLGFELRVYVGGDFSLLARTSDARASRR